MSANYPDNENIWLAADNFRNSAEMSGCNIPPIDVMFILDVILKFHVIDIPGLFADLRMDAAIVPAKSTVYVDRDSLESWDRKDYWIEKRLRFSLAHELGHFILHKDYMSKVVFLNITQFKHWIIEHHSNDRKESQADEFAGRFLVPRDILLSEYDICYQKFRIADQKWHEIEGMREHIAKKIAPRFGVNHQVIETRFDREDIWPLE